MFIFIQARTFQYSHRQLINCQLQSTKCRTITKYCRCNFIFSKMMREGGPALLCQRNSRNQTAREVALSLNLPAHIDVIDDMVTDWLTSNKHGADECRSLLALYSYDFGSLFDSKANVDGVATYKEEFYRLQVNGFHQSETIN